MSDVFTFDLETIRRQCLSSLSTYSCLAAVNSLNPIPTMCLCVDAGLCLKMFADIRMHFHLDEDAAAELRQYDVFVPLLNRIFSYATEAGVNALLEKTTGSSLSHYIPYVGQIVTGALNYSTIKLLGEAYIDDCYDLVKMVQDRAILVTPINRKDDTK